MKMSKAKVLLAGIGLIGLAALGGLAYLRGQSRVEYRIAKVDRGDIEVTISATGNPNAVVTVQVGSQVSGNIKELYADFNTKVKKGQLVARIDPEIFVAKVNQAQADLDNTRAAVLTARAMLQKTEADIASAKGSLGGAKANVAKAKVAVLDARIKRRSRINLFKEGGISAEERDSARATYDANVAALEAVIAQEQAAHFSLRAAQAQHEVAVAQLASAEAQVKQSEGALRQTRIDLDHTYIRAPVDGTVIARNMDVGQTVAASLSAPTLFLIAQDLTKMQVDTNVDEADIGRVRVGQPATFTVDAYLDETFMGKVVQIRQAAINVQNVITYNAVIAVSNPDLKLFPGMTASVKIMVDRRENILKIPNAALRFRPPDFTGQRKPGGDASTRTPQEPPIMQWMPGFRSTRRAGGDQTIWVLGEDGKPRPITVKLGITDESFSEVIGDNLSVGQAVIIGIVPGGGQAAGGPTWPRF